MKKPRTRLSFRLGKLAKPLDSHCEKTGETHSEVGRKALATKLGVDAPKMPQGFAAMSKKRANVIRKRRGKKNG